MKYMNRKYEKMWANTTKKKSALERSAVLIALFAAMMISLSSIVPTAINVENKKPSEENGEGGFQEAAVPFGNYTLTGMSNSTVTGAILYTPTSTSGGISVTIGSFNVTSYTRVTIPQKPKIYILVEEGIYGSITTEINRYMIDVRSEGKYETVLYHRNWVDEVEVKDLLRSGYNTNNLAGALFVGNIPVAYFEMDDNFVGTPVTHVTFPMDLFYMDLDGTWDDTDLDGSYDLHIAGTGDRAPEIFVGRLYASTVTIPGENEISLIRNYFDKNHEYRIGNLPLTKRALVFVDNDWIQWSQRFDGEVGLLYNDHLLYDNPTWTDATAYKNGLVADYEWISVFVHSSQYRHRFDMGMWYESIVTSTEISQADPTSHFYNLHACRAARYTYAINDGYLGGHYIFSETNGVCAVGQTKDGGMFYTYDFYSELGNGANIGEAFITWFTNNGWRVTPEIPNPDDWSYGMTILGDPTLVPNMP
jgi:hypothetical protein